MNRDCDFCKKRESLWKCKKCGTVFCNWCISRDFAEGFY